MDRARSLNIETPKASPWMGRLRRTPEGSTAKVEKTVSTGEWGQKNRAILLSIGSRQHSSLTVLQGLGGLLRGEDPARTRGGGSRVANGRRFCQGSQAAEQRGSA
jgi:hypothetical protein